MQPIVVMPLNDPQGLLFPRLRAVTSRLKEIFARAYVSVPIGTAWAQPESTAWLKSEPFFQAIYHDRELSVGEDFLALYRFAAASCPPDQVLHLCFIDRVAFALESEDREQFAADIRAVLPSGTPLIFMRSPRAWETHPRNYRELEDMVTRAGELLFTRTLDFAWCHLAVQAGRLLEVLPGVRRRDLSLVAELVIPLRADCQTQEVDWLAWEDPFIFSRPAGELKAEREGSRRETCRRLAYVIPMLQLLHDAARKAARDAAEECG